MKHVACLCYAVSTDREQERGFSANIARRHSQSKIAIAICGIEPTTTIAALSMIFTVFQKRLEDKPGIVNFCRSVEDYN